MNSTTELPASEGHDNTDQGDVAALVNDRLRRLVEASGLQPAVAMTIFNRGLAPNAACSESQWKAYLADPAEARFQVLSEELLAHATERFSQIGINADSM